MKIAFISVMSAVPWGGSEILWSRTALRLKLEGHSIFASVCWWPEIPKAVVELREQGVLVKQRLLPNNYFTRRFLGKIISRLNPRLINLGFKGSVRKLAKFSPDLVCISHGDTGSGLKWMEWCLQHAIPFVSVSQANAEQFWPSGQHADRLLRAHSSAAATCFVSRGNLELFETQLGAKLANAQVVWNPIQVTGRLALEWPDGSDGLRLACVGRLDPSAKGQDLILKVLARASWRARSVTVSFFGEGPMESSLKRLAASLDVLDRVRFCGHVDSIDEVWKHHHALILPSRYEGLPLAVIEAMFCGRPAIVTDVAGNREVVHDNITGFLAQAPTETHLAEAMERFWEKRGGIAEMGQLAAESIRQLLPDDPIASFASFLTSCTGPMSSGGRYTRRTVLK